ncbi:hypothetical protein MICA_1489 [Micavibrio aeruginosavorus ARL-13]|uniref:Uncharacterized protein n=1 Tax=Micavibrio aeruginosavorus (strain ARL-13) TaxID=856793 RepID=G2KNF9_MICAA|nr:hypothetical protein MICA_1489 [Micavibrio aeruginosavorus ARL-13]
MLLCGAVMMLWVKSFVYGSERKTNLINSIPAKAGIHGA